MPVPSAPGLPPTQNQPVTGFPHFQPPGNMPNIDFSARVIRMGTGGPSKEGGPRARDDGNKRGLGSHQGSDAQKMARESQVALTEPTSHEVSRTIFVDVPSFLDDAKMEYILRSVGGLRRWIRLREADDKSLNVGSAEFDDAESLKTAATVLPNIKVPIREAKKEKKSEDNDDMQLGDVAAEEANGVKITEVPLKISVDDQSLEYAEEWLSKRPEDAALLEGRVSKAQANLEQVLARLVEEVPGSNLNADQNALSLGMEETHDPMTGEVVTIPIEAKDEDELSNVPYEQREHVAAEIAAFRERSIKRDIERQKREEAIEAVQKRDSKGLPSGPAHGANGIPVGPRGGPPSAPRSMQTPQPQANGIRQTKHKYPVRSGWKTAEDEDVSSDDALERRRLVAQKDKDSVGISRALSRLEDQERKCRHQKERKVEVKRTEASKSAKRRATTSRFLKNFRSRHHSALPRSLDLWFRSRDHWHNDRKNLLRDEQEKDDEDRLAEDKELRSQKSREDNDHPMPDADGHSAPVQPKIGLKLKLGSKPQTSTATTKPKARSALAYEALLDDEAAAEQLKRRPIKKLKFDTADEAALLTDEERAAAREQITINLTRDKDALFKYPIEWEYVNDTALEGPIMDRAKSLMSARVGADAVFLSEYVMAAIRVHNTPEAILSILKSELDTVQAEDFLRDLWRYIIVFMEINKRGLADMDDDET